MNHSDYIESSQLQPVPGPEIRPDRQEPGPVPRDLIPREWLENKRLPDVLAHGIVVMAAGPTGLCFLTALHYWMPRSKNIYDGKIWVYNTLEKWCGYTGLPIGTLRRTIDALVNAGIVETWRPNRRQPIRYTLNYPKLRELAKAELIKAGYWPNSECDQIDHTQTAESDQINHTQSDQIDHTQTAESDQINHTQTAESDQNGQTIQETNLYRKLTIHRKTKIHRKPPPETRQGVGNLILSFWRVSQEELSRIALSKQRLLHLLCRLWRE